MIWLLLVILLIILIVSVSRGNKKKNLEIQKLQTEVNQVKTDEKPVLKSSIADELTKLKDLREQGILTEEEFNTQKAKLLS